MAGLRASAARVQATLTAYGVAADVRELDQSTRTAVDAASAVGSDVGQIAKSIWAPAGTPFAVFRLAPSVLVTMTEGIVAHLALPRR